MSGAVIAACMMAAACSVLSVFVLARRWAFIGEGISHAGLGGAGTAWLLMLVFPALVQQTWVIPLMVVVFCVATAMAIGYFSRGDRVKSDAVIGIFLVATLAWGFLAREIYQHVRNVEPAGFGEVLWGRLNHLPPQYAIAGIIISLGVLVTLAALGKEILYYCLDPQMAAASGVRTELIHYLLMLLVALTIVVGIPVVGSVMVTALLILPAASAGLVTRDLRATLIGAIAVGVAGVLVGAMLAMQWRFLPSGPAIVLALFAEFLAAYVFSRVRGRNAIA